MGDTRTLFVLGFPEASQARAALAEIGNLGNPGFLKADDWAIVERDANGKVTFEESPSADHGAARGAVAGGVAGAFLVVLGPVGWAGPPRWPGPARWRRSCATAGSRRTTWTRSAA